MSASDAPSQKLPFPSITGPCVISVDSLLLGFAVVLARYGGTLSYEEEYRIIDEILGGVIATSDSPDGEWSLGSAH